MQTTGHGGTGADARLRVLVVDDDPTFLLLTRVWLSRVPHVELIGTGTDGRMAMELAATLQPDVVVLDVHMPELDGIGAIPTIRAACGRVRIVMHSNDLTRRDEALAAGADAWVTKTGSRTGLLEALRARGEAIS